MRWLFCSHRLFLAHTPMPGHRLTRPNRAHFFGGVIANRENEIELWSSGFCELIPVLTSHPAGRQSSNLQLPQCLWVNTPSGVTSCAVSSEIRESLFVAQVPTAGRYQRSHTAVMQVTARRRNDGSIGLCLYTNIQVTRKGGPFVEAALDVTPAAKQAKRLNPFERYLTLWVALCMVIGVALGKSMPGFVQNLRSLEFGRGSQVNVPIAILIWLMIIPMMMKVDFASILSVREKPHGLLITLFVNWLVKPFSMALISGFSGTFSARGFRALLRTNTSRERSFLQRHRARQWFSFGVT